MNSVATAKLFLFGCNVRPNERGIQSVFLLVKRFKASAVVHQPSTTVTTAEDVEWAQAKPFDQIPGLKSLPILGTAWAMFPVVGKVYLFENTALINLYSALFVFLSNRRWFRSQSLSFSASVEFQ